MIVAGIRLRRGIALALFCHNMEQRRPGLGTDRLQDALQLRLVVAVDEAEIMEPHVLEDRGVVHGPAHHFFAVLQGSLDGCADERHPAQEAVDILLRREITGRGAQMAQIPCQCADIVGDGHLVVIENDHQIVQLADVVHSLVDHAAGKGTIADDGHHMARLALELFGPCDADGDREGGVAVPGDKSIVNALIRVWETRKAVQLPQGAEALIPSGQQFVGVALMAHIENERIPGGLKDAMERDRQLDCAEVGSKMSARFGYTVQQKLTNFPAELLDLRTVQALQVTWL